MLRQLLESRPARHRTRSAAVLSLVVHLGLAGTAVAATATHVLPEPEPEPIADLLYIPTPAPQVPPRAKPAAPARPVTPELPSTTPPLDVPVDVPSTLPPIDPNATATTTPDYGTSTPSGPVGDGTDPAGTATGSGDDAPFWFEDVERAAAPLGRQRQPRYPEALRSARVEGGVTVTFVVDTLGRVEPASIRITESAHALFEPAVQAALKQTRFRPARVRGGPVRQLVQQRFVFALTR